MKKVLIFLVIVVLNINTYAIFRSPEAGRYYYWLFSPELLSRSMGVVGTKNPSGVVINPASLAFVQRYKIDFSYGLSPGFWASLYTNESFLNSGDFFWPFIINAGVIIPSKYGNFTIYTNYMNMSNMGYRLTNNNDLGIGKIGSIYFGYSKDYSDNIAFGISGNLKLSYNPLLKPDLSKPSKEFDIGGGIDLGFVYKPDFFVPFSKKKDTRWAWQDFEFAITVKDLGKPLIYFPVENKDDLPWFANPFTPAVGFSINIYNDGATYWKFLGDFTAPFCQNFTLALGTEIQIYKFLVLRTSYTFDLEGVLEYTGAINKYGYIYNIANVGFGLSIRFRSDFAKKQTKQEALKNKHKTTSFSIDLGGRPYHHGFIFELGCAITIGVRDETPPDINFIQNDTYSSPNLDGIQDEIVIDLDIKDDRYVIYWKLEIYDENKNIVRTIESKEQRKESMKAKDVFKKFFSPKSGIPIPKQVIWDGRDNQGNVVTDGAYTFKFFAMDDNKNINNEGSRVGSVVIDTQKPEVKSEVTNKVFSPNDDGRKDVLIIDIDIIKEKVEGIKEDILVPNKILIKEKSIPSIIKDNVDNIEHKTEEKSKKQIWYVDIFDVSDKVIKSYIYEEKGKKRLEWDAKDEKGNKVPDGIYKVKLHSTDEAGNYWEEIITNIIINTEPTPIEATILNNIFSPNGDKINDEIGLKFMIPIQKGIERWKFEILSSNDEIVKTFLGEGIPDLEMKWNGKDSNDIYAQEGEYSGKLTVIYENGNMPEGITPAFTIDVTPPNGKINISKNIFSPDGDGKLDEITISHSTSEEEEWQGIIYDSSDKKVKSYIWKSQPPQTFTWDGKNNKNRLLKDGTYKYQIVCTDLAGNYFESEENEIKIFTSDTPVFITSSLESFSPNMDNIKDSQFFEIHANISKENKVSKWKLSIFDDNDRGFYTLKRKGALPKSLEWPGIANDKKIASDGYYYAKLSVEFEAGNASESKSQLFSIDTVPPKIELKANSMVFSPNNDGHLDVFEILQKGSEEDQWETYITAKDKKVLWKKFYKGYPCKKEIWNGKDINGNIQKNGFYRYTIECTDKAGNQGRVVLKNLKIKNVFTSAFLTLDEDKFSPNKDGKFDKMSFRPVVSVKDDLEVYKLEILDIKKNVIKTFQGKKEIPKKIEWDGIDTNGKVASDGIYTAKLSAIYNFGNRPKIESAKFILDTTPPNINLSVKPKYFSPDNDGNEDELSIFVKSSDLTGIKNWKISILTPNTKKEFNSFKGKGNPTNKITWKGKSNKGALVESAEDYPLKIYAEDEVGNILDKEAAPIMVDILVIKLKDGRLKIKISNIQFKPDSPLMTDSPKNKKILDLIAKALKKYRQYHITVEGHANRFKKGLDEVKAKKLSEQRAKKVVEQLSKRGISIKRMTIYGKGFDNPLVPLTKDAKKDELARNRRVEFYLDKNR